jgi:hypothetical protein
VNVYQTIAITCQNKQEQNKQEQNKSKPKKQEYKKQSVNHHLELVPVHNHNMPQP